MFVLIWATLLFADKVASEKSNVCAGGTKNCITLPEGNITAEAGLCVVVPCSFTRPYNVRSISWNKCSPECNTIIFNSTTKENVDPGFRGRVSLLDTVQRKKNCSIIIKDLTESDSGSYQVTVHYQDKNPNIFTAKATIVVTATETKTADPSGNEVMDLSQKPTVMIPPLTEGQQTTLSCTAPGLCPGSVPNFTWTWRGEGENDSHISGNITHVSTEGLSSVNQTYSSTLTFNSSAEHHGTEITCKISFTGNTTTEETKTLNVTYVKELKISGNTNVQKGDALNLTCSVDSFPASFITWTKFGSNKSLLEEFGNEMQNNNGHASLTIPTVTAEHDGRYTCTARHLKVNLTKNITVTHSPTILSSSVCKVESDVLTCVCISEGIPLPAIEWPLLRNHTEYSVTTTVSNHSVTSTVTVSMKGQNNSFSECIRSNGREIAKLNNTIEEIKQQQEDLYTKLLKIAQQPESIVSFLFGLLIGISLSAIIACLARKCCRKKQKRSVNLEMVTTDSFPQMDGVGAADDDGIRYQQAAEGGAASTAQAASDGGQKPKEVEYSHINFSAMKRKNPAEGAAEETQDTAETEYAEIKKEEMEDRQDYGGGEDGERLEGDEEKEVMIEEDKEPEECIPAEEEEEKGGGDVALYSNVKEIMGEI